MDQSGVPDQHTHEDHDANEHHGQDAYSASEAAALLHLGKRRVLQMLERKELAGEKELGTGRWLVYAPHLHALLRERRHLDQRKRSKDPTEESTPPASEETRELLMSFKDQVSYLREELHRREELHAEESRRKDHIIAALTQRIPELEASRDAPGSPETPTEPSRSTQAPEPSRAPQTGTQRRSWWRRVVGG